MLYSMASDTGLAASNALCVRLFLPTAVADDGDRILKRRRCSRLWRYAIFIGDEDSGEICFLGLESIHWADLEHAWSSRGTRDFDKSKACLAATPRQEAKGTADIRELNRSPTTQGVSGKKLAKY